MYIYTLVKMILSLLFLVSAISQIGLRAEPSFISRSETFKFVAGDTITLPCQVSDVGKGYIQNESCPLSFF